MVEAASDMFVVVMDDSKLVFGLGGSGLATPMEIVQFYWKYNLVGLQELFKEEGGSRIVQRGRWICHDFRP
ncbi:hypothetical protein L6452_18712 [Arctium lappa]|uniref:Uncharacterized protein n=1 Tax=Arctium lappa TaxID=4217 RepID=A0ACB9C6U6_ARCLA|nr:hypothetical protein L6452_18712 [Arctium lappa]